MEEGDGRRWCSSPVVTASASLSNLPNEILFHILGFLDVSDLLSTSRVSVVRTVLAPFAFGYKCRVE